MLAACGGDTNDQNNIDNSNNNKSTIVLTTGSNNGETPGNGTIVSNNATNTTPVSALNYYTDIKPIMDHSCVSCHMQGGVAPFALNTFEDVYSIRALIAASVKSGSMPPFLADSDCRDYQFDPSLSDKQISDIEEWATSDAKEGDKNKPGKAIGVEAYTPPILDTVLEMAEPYTPKLSPDDYRCFVIDWPHETDKFITGFGVTPGSPSIVHHMIAFLATPENVDKALAFDAAEDGPGYTCFGDSGLGDGAWVGSWAPGGVDSAFPEGTGSKIKARSKIILQIHYSTLETDPIADLSSVKFRTADRVEKEGFFLPFANPAWLNAGSMKIPAGDADVKHQVGFDILSFIDGATQMNIFSGGLHMHLLGTSIKSWIERSNGDDECLIDIPKWDFNWQSGVAFEKVAVLERGDKLNLECHWDNSIDNQPVINGKRRTPADVSWGEGTGDEMCLGVFFVTID